METNPLFLYCLRLADTSLILAQQLSAWTSRGPFLEEDLALTNITLDTLGRANALLIYAAQVEGKGRNEDDLAFHRNERQFYNKLLVEQPNGDYAQTMVRQFFIDAFNVLFFAELAKSKDETLAAIAQKSLKEIQYHYRHSSIWIDRFGNGTEESHNRAQQAVNNLWAYTGELFEMDEIETILLEKGIGVDLQKLKPEWEKRVKEVLVNAGVSIPENTFMQTGGNTARHTEHLGFILAEMQILPRMIPNAKW